MKISLQIVFEKLNLDKSENTLISPHKSKFSEIRLYTPRITVLKSGILYIGDQYPRDQAVFEPGCGLCLQNNPMKFPCDILFVKKEIPNAELFNQISEVFTNIRNQIETLTQAVYQKKGLQRVIEIVTEICGNPAYLLDSSFKVLAIFGPEIMSEMSINWKRLIESGYLAYDVVMNLIESNELSLMESGLCADMIVSKYFYTPFINYNMRYKGTLQGHLFIVGMLKELSLGSIELTDCIGPLVLQAILSDSNFQEARGRYYEHFIIDMLEGKPIRTEYINQQMKALHLNMDSFFSIVKIKPQSQNELKLEQIARQLENFNGSKPVHYKGNIVAIFPLGDHGSDESLSENLKALSINLNFRIGVSDVMHGFLNIHVQYIQASAAIVLGEMLNVSENLYLYRDMAIYHSFLSVENENDLLAMCHNGVLHLDEYDTKHNTELVLTLKTYLKYERHVMLTAPELHIHRNSLAYRINKINDICHFSLDDPTERERIVFSLYILNYLKTKIPCDDN